MECHVPIAEVDGVTIAVLLAQTSQYHMGLLLHPVDDNDLRDPQREMYYTGWSFITPEGGQKLCRIAFLGNDLYNLRFRDQIFKAEWKHIVIRTLPHPGAVHNTLHPLPLSGVDRVSMTVLNRMKGVPFHIPPWLVNSLHNLSFFPVVGMTGNETEHRITLQFNNISSGESLFIHLGVCMPSKAHWAQATIVHGNNVPEAHELGHQCDGDHVDGWPEGQKVFKGEGRQLKLTFVRCLHRPRSTRVLHLDLEGGVYEDLQHKNGVYIRSTTILEKSRLQYEQLTTQAVNLPVLRLLPTNADCSQDLGPTPPGGIASHTLSHETSVSVNDIALEFRIANFISRIRTQAVVGLPWFIGSRMMLYTCIAGVHQSIKDQLQFGLERVKLVLVATTLVLLHPILALLKRALDGHSD